MQGYHSANPLLMSNLVMALLQASMNMMILKTPKRSSMKTQKHMRRTDTGSGAFRIMHGQSHAIGMGGRVCAEMLIAMAAGK